MEDRPIRGNNLVDRADVLSIGGEHLHETRFSPDVPGIRGGVAPCDNLQEDSAAAFGGQAVSSKSRSNSLYGITAMPELLAIDSVTIEHVRDATSAGLREGPPYEAIADFVARVDWSGTHKRIPPIAGVLGKLEAWSTEYAEGDLTSEDYAARLRELLAGSEQARKSPAGGG